MYWTIKTPNRNRETQLWEIAGEGRMTTMKTDDNPEDSVAITTIVGYDCDGVPCDGRSGNYVLDVNMTLNPPCGDAMHANVGSIWKTENTSWACAMVDPFETDIRWLGWLYDLSGGPRAGVDSFGFDGVDNVPFLSTFPFYTFVRVEESKHHNLIDAIMEMTRKFLSIRTHYETSPIRSNFNFFTNPDFEVRSVEDDSPYIMPWKDRRSKKPLFSINNENGKPIFLGTCEETISKVEYWYDFENEKFQDTVFFMRQIRKHQKMYVAP